MTAIVVMGEVKSVDSVIGTSVCSSDIVGDITVDVECASDNWVDAVVASGIGMSISESPDPPLLPSSISPDIGISILSLLSRSEFKAVEHNNHIQH